MSFVCEKARVFQRTAFFLDLLCQITVSLLRKLRIWDGSRVAKSSLQQWLLDGRLNLFFFLMMALQYFGNTVFSFLIFSFKFLNIKKLTILAICYNIIRQKIPLKYCCKYFTITILIHSTYCLIQFFHFFFICSKELVANLTLELITVHHPCGVSAKMPGSMVATSWNSWITNLRCLFFGLQNELDNLGHTAPSSDYPPIIALTVSVAKLVLVKVVYVFLKNRNY